MNVLLRIILVFKKFLLRLLLPGFLIASSIGFAHTLYLWLVTSEVWSLAIAGGGIVGFVLQAVSLPLGFILGMLDIYGSIYTYAGSDAGWEFCGINVLLNYVLDDLFVLVCTYIPTLCLIRMSLRSTGKKRIALWIVAFLTQYIVAILAFHEPITYYVFFDRHVINPNHACSIPIHPNANP